MVAPDSNNSGMVVGRRGISVAFLVLAIGAFLDLNTYLSALSIILSIIAIVLLIAYRKSFSGRQRRAVYGSIVLYIVISFIVIGGLVAVTFTFIKSLLTEGFSVVIPAQYVNNVFNQIFPLLILNAAASDGLCYYLLAMRLLHRVDHAIYIGALVVSVTLRVLVLVLTHQGSLPIPQQVSGYLSVIRTDFYNPYEAILSISASLILGLLLLYVSIQISRGRVLDQ